MATMVADTETRPTRAITVAEWELLEDPEGGKFEVIDGHVVLMPSPDADHNRFSEDLADLFRLAIEQAGLDFDVTLDVEWRQVEDGRVMQAPRGDLVVGRVDPDKRIHFALPTMVVEIWDPESRPGVRNKRRAYWAARGLRHFWQVLVTEPAVLEVFDLAQPHAPLQQAVGDQVVEVSEPFSVSVTPSAVAGWSLRMAKRADSEAIRANTEAGRANAEADRADALQAEVERLQAELRALRGD